MSAHFEKSMVLSEYIVPRYGEEPEEPEEPGRAGTAQQKSLLMGKTLNPQVT